MDSIIFDLDGTLWDSTEVVAEAWTKVLQEKAGLDITITTDRLHQLFGQLMPEIARQLFPEETHDRQIELIDLCCEAEHDALLANPPHTYEGLENTLEILSQKLPLFIVSNCQAGYIEVFLAATGFEKYFQGHLCPGDTDNGKGDNIKQIIAENHLKSPVYVGDTSGDYSATKEAGIPFVWAAYGFGDVDTPDYVINKPKDLLNLI